MSNTSTDPGDRSSADLERDVDRERARVAGTIDALQDRVSVNRIVDDVVKAVTEHGGDVSRNLGRTLKDNPVPAILTGVGLAWLMAGSGSKPRDSYDRYEDADWDRNYGRDRGLSPYPVSDYGTEPLSDNSFGATSTPYAGGLDDARNGSSTERDGPSMRDRLSDASESVRDRAAGALGSARDGLHDATDRARDGMSAASARASDAAHRARMRTRQGGQAARETFERLLDDQPLVVGALALALGAAFGGILPRTKTEDELMGEKSDQLKGDLTASVQTNFEKVKAVGMAVADEAMTMADEVAGEADKRTPKGSDIAESAKSAAGKAGERLRERAEDEADKQGLDTDKLKS